MGGQLLMMGGQLLMMSGKLLMMGIFWTFLHIGLG